MGVPRPDPPGADSDARPVAPHNPKGQASRNVDSGGGKSYRPKRLSYARAETAAANRPCPVTFDLGINDNYKFIAPSSSHPHHQQPGSRPSTGQVTALERALVPLPNSTRRPDLSKSESTRGSPPPRAPESKASGGLACKKFSNIQCDKIFHTQHSLERHIKAIHFEALPAITAYVCFMNGCGFWSLNDFFLNIHEQLCEFDRWRIEREASSDPRSKHGPDFELQRQRDLRNPDNRIRKYRCSLCYRCFMGIEAVYQHVETVHQARKVVAAPKRNDNSWSYLQHQPLSNGLAINESARGAGANLIEPWSIGYAGGAESQKQETYMYEPKNEPNSQERSLEASNSKSEIMNSLGEHQSHSQIQISGGELGIFLDAKAVDTGCSHTDGIRIGESLIQETAARVKFYAIRRTIEIVRQKFLQHLLSLSRSSTGGGSSSNEATGPSTGSGTSEDVSIRDSRRKQLRNGKRKVRQSEEGDGDDDEADGDNNRKKKPRMASGSPGVPNPRYACIYFASAMKSKTSNLSSLDLTKWATECYRSGFETIARVKSHLYSHHRYGCKKCHRVLASAELFHEHIEKGCNESTGDPPLYLSRGQAERLKSKKPIPGINTEEKRWSYLYKIVFEDQDAIPSPYWQAISLDCNRQHIDSFQQRDELFGLLKEQFEAAVDMKELSGPLIKALMEILKEVWAKVVDTITEKYPVPEISGEGDPISWKAIFNDIVDQRTQNEAFNSVGECSNSTCNTEDASGSNSEGIGDAIDDPSADLRPSNLPDPVIPESLLGLEKSQLDVPLVPAQEWKYDPWTGKPLYRASFLEVLDWPHEFTALSDTTVPNFFS
ncbi:hypothetical protein TWF281_004593 [Arthrobotrys megalospora]